MKHTLENIFNEEDYRYKVYGLFKDHEDRNLSEEQLKEGLKKHYSELLEGATAKNLQLMENKNPFWALWDKALQQMTSDEYETSFSQIRECWSDFTDYYFAMWYLRRAEELLGIKSEPLN